MSSKALNLIIDNNNTKLKNSNLIEKINYLKDYQDLIEESDEDDENIDVCLDTSCSLDMTKSTTTVNFSSSSSPRSKNKSISKHSLFRSDTIFTPNDFKSQKCQKNSNSKEKLKLFLNLLAKLVDKFNKSLRNSYKFKSTNNKINNPLYYKKNLKKKLFILSLIKTFKQFENASKFLVELLSENEIKNKNETILYNYDEEETQCLLNVKKLKSTQKIRPEIVKCKHLESKNNRNQSSLSTSLSHTSSTSSSENVSPKINDRRNRKRYTIRKNTSSVNSSSSSSKKLEDFIKYESILDSEKSSDDKKMLTSKKLNFKLSSSDISNHVESSLIESQDLNNLNISSNSSDLILLNNSLENKCKQYEQNLRNLSQELINIKKFNELKFNKEFKLMARSEYEALKLQLNTFREDYRMEHNEKVHLRIYYEEKLRNLESSNTELTNKLNKLIILSEAYDSFDSSVANIF
ncbi:unnamed protein product [Brachionus calyciflorus]|uniref:Uncharacterized protein n=1 Tax=Brachionus calyciflorus TaxID=104777 RepID=A0A813M3Z7_9BILA|nr:unnamed protein product [Brachionus calyciflorus]